MENGNVTFVYENQITHVLIKNVFGNNCWVKVDDLYKMFPSGVTIRPDEKYNIDVEFSTVELPTFPEVRLSPISSNSLNYVIYDEEAVGESLFEKSFKHFLKEDKKMNFLNFEVEHNSIWDSDAMRCRLEFEIDMKEAYKYEPLMKQARGSLQTRQFGEFVLSAFLDATNLPKPKKVIFNDPATIVFWEDGSKTVVKRSEGEPDDKEKAIMYCVFKKVIGNKSKMDKYIKSFMKEEKKDEKKKEAGGSKLRRKKPGTRKKRSKSAV